MKRKLTLLVTLTLVGLSAHADILAQWNFNAADATAAAVPSAGAGKLTPVGGITVAAPTTASGSSDPATSGDTAYQTSKYPAAGAANRTAGIEVAVSTAGYKNITFSFDYRGSATSSRQLAVLYSLDGTSFFEGVLPVILKDSVFTNGIPFDLSAIAGANNNPAFKLRVVTAFTGAAYQAIAGNYSTTGTARFDMVTVRGEALGGLPVAPAIVTPPQSRTNFVGASASLTVVASGTQPLTFAWEKEVNPGEWQAVSGGVNSTLTLANVQFTDAGKYRVRVSNDQGSAISDPAELTVREDPANVVSAIAHLRTLLNPTTLVPADTTTLYQVEGVVTTHLNLTGAADSFFYLQDATGGIGVFVSRGAGVVPPAGARVRVTGPLGHFNGLLELNLLTATATHKVETLSTGNPLPEPLPLNYAWPTTASAVDDLGVIDAESNEARLVIATNMLIDATSPAFTSGSNVTLTDATDPSKTFTLRVDSRVLDIIGQQKPTGPATIVGVLSQFDSSDPRAGGYQLLPTRYADIQSATKAPSIRFTNTLSNLVRPGDALTNTFAEQVLRPGESLRIGFSVTDPDGRPVDVTLGTAIPEGGDWNFASTSGTQINGQFNYTAIAAAAGHAYDVSVTANNGSASFTQTVRIYVPTAAEQRVVITEYYANPASTNAVAWFNPLNRAELLPGGTDASPSNRDEFVELVNLSDETLDLSDWMLSDSLARRAYLYPGTPGISLAPSNSVVVYGGPATGYAPQLAVPAIAAEAGPGDAFSNAGLALNNDGDTLILRNADSNLVARVVYTAAMTSTNGSMTRFPTDRDGFVAHRSTGLLHWSPGTQADGQAWTAGQPNADVGPAFTTMPVSVTVAAGTPANFTVVATGLPAPTYQWLRGGVNLLGETASDYTLASPQLTDDGASFQVIVANRVGSITSAPVTLTVTAPPPEIIKTNLAYLRSQVDPVNLRPVNTTQLYEVEGIVTTHVNLTGSANSFFFLQDDTAGISAFVTGKPGGETPPAGARVRLVGPLGHFNGLLELNLVATNAKHVVEVLSTGNALPAPIVLDYEWPTVTTDITPLTPGVSSAEANEGRLVRVDNVLVDSSPGASFTSGSNVTVTDGTDFGKTFVLRIDSRVTEVIGQPKPNATETVSLVGVLGQFDGADPRAGGYQLIVTRLADIITAATPELITATAVVSSDSVTLSWNATPGATYSVFRSSSAAGPFLPVANGLNAASYTEAIAGQPEAYFRITSP